MAKQDDIRPTLEVLRAAAQRARIAQRLAGDPETALLQSIVDATVTLFDAEAASIAIFERDPERLEFRVAAGEQGAGAIGLSVPPSKGIAGFVFSTGQPLALSDVMSDPRFDRATAERTGYVPRSIAAVPLVDERGAGTVGVLQLLDKHTSPTFTLRDMELLGVFAAQAAAAIHATRVQRDLDELLRQALGRLADDVDADAIDAVVSAATTELDPDADAPFWGLVDRFARRGSLGERESALAADLLDLLVRYAAPARRRG
ncbi:MAG: GAF domain-containing protein [Candidatus Limnocylindrales bacterium]